MIPRVWGTMKIPATMIFAAELIETMHTHEASKKGGKGLFGNSAKNYTFTYSVDAAWAVCVGPAYSDQPPLGEPEAAVGEPAVAGQ